MCFLVLLKYGGASIESVSAVVVGVGVMRSRGCGRLFGPLTRTGLACMRTILSDITTFHKSDVPEEMHREGQRHDSDT